MDARVASFDRVLVHGRQPEQMERLHAKARAAYDAVATPDALFTLPRTRGARRVPVARIPVVQLPGVPGTEALLDDHLAALRPFVADLVRRWRPDVIHAHTGLPDGIIAAEVGREHRIPVVVTEHASTIETVLADPVAVERYRTLLEPDVRLLAVSPSLATRLAKLLDIEPDRIQVLPNPIAVANFPLGGDANRDPGQLLWVGSLGKHKDIDVLLRAFAQLRERRPGLRLRLIGAERKAGDRAELAALARELKVADDVRFDDWLDRKEVAHAMLRSSVFVHPSPAETFRSRGSRGNADRLARRDPSLGRRALGHRAIGRVRGGGRGRRDYLVRKCDRGGARRRAARGRRNGQVAPHRRVQRRRRGRGSTRPLPSRHGPGRRDGCPDIVPDPRNIRTHAGAVGRTGPQPGRAPGARPSGGPTPPPGARCAAPPTWAHARAAGRPRDATGRGRPHHPSVRPEPWPACPPGARARAVPAPR